MERIAILPASEAGGRLKNLLENFDSVVLLKAKRLRGVIEELRELGALENALVFAKCGGRNFKVFPLSAYDMEKGEYFSMILIRRMK
jgi:precorrin-2 methylase